MRADPHQSIRQDGVFLGEMDSSDSQGEKDDCSYPEAGTPEICKNHDPEYFLAFHPYGKETIRHYIKDYTFYQKTESIDFFAEK
jgi:hypothetical protein